MTQNTPETEQSQVEPTTPPALTLDDYTPRLWEAKRLSAETVRIVDESGPRRWRISESPETEDEVRRAGYDPNHHVYLDLEWIAAAEQANDTSLLAGSWSTTGIGHLTEDFEGYPRGTFVLYGYIDVDWDAQPTMITFLFERRPAAADTIE